MCADPGRRTSAVSKLVEVMVEVTSGAPILPKWQDVMEGTLGTGSGFHY